MTPHLRVPRSELLAAYEQLVIRTTPDDCWGWRGATSQGYGVITLRTGNVSAHRASFYLFTGAINEPDILHLCHNRTCSNPAHLRQGTRKENMATSRVDGRMQRRVPLVDLPRIVERRARGESLAAIGESYGCSKQAIRHLIQSHGLDDSKGRRRDPDTMLTFRGETLPLRTWAKRLGIPHATLRYRYVRRGWTAERSLTQPIMRGDAAARHPLLE